jgi:hypothetical protein
MISSFISGTLPWSVAVLVIAIIFRKPIAEKLKHLTSIKRHGLEVYFSEENRIIAQKIDNTEKNMKQPAARPPADDYDTNNDPEFAIPFIYSKIETAVREKFRVSGSYDIFPDLYESKKIDSGTLIIIDSMRSLRDYIHSFVRSQKITKEDIDNYRSNADRIIKIIQEIEL